MPTKNQWLLDHAANVHSQAGEDGVLAKVLEIIGASTKWCVEFGAWDGKYLSNTYNLIESQGFSAVMIEGSEKRHGDLVATFRGQPACHSPPRIRRVHGAGRARRDPG